jgi:hypothetical protein
LGEDKKSRIGKKRIATMKFATQLHDRARDERAGMAGEGTSSETRRNGTGPRPIEKDA